MRDTRFGNEQDLIPRFISRISHLGFGYRPFFRGTLAPVRRASESPIAIACLRLVTFFPERPLFKVPRLRSCIALLTFCAAFFPYLAMVIPPLCFVQSVSTLRFEQELFHAIVTFFRFIRANFVPVSKTISLPRPMNRTLPMGATRDEIGGMNCPQACSSEKS